jgi:hypothetical protein
MSFVGEVPCTSCHWNVLYRANFRVLLKSLSSGVDRECTDGGEAHGVCALRERPVVGVRLH